MAFAKKVVVLKQVTEGYSINDKPLCGICRLETEDEITTAFLSFVGIKATAQGEYSLFILCDKGNLLHFSLGNQPRAVTESFTPAVDLEKGFSAGLFFVKNDLPVLIAYRKTEIETNRIHARRILQNVGEQTVVINPPYEPLKDGELDESYEYPYMRAPHPRYKKRGPVPAFEMIKFSINTHRGCFGGCSFCAINAHQGKFIASRSRESILREVEIVTNMPGFAGTISDLGGPSANMYKMRGKDRSRCEKCARPSCVFPRICDNMNTRHHELTELYKEVAKNPKIKHLFIGSGVRYDLILQETTDKSLQQDHMEYARQLIQHHVSGRLKVAPEHTSDGVLSLIRKPSFSLFYKFKELFDKESALVGKNQQIIPYFISSHPGCTEKDMAELALETKQLGFKLEQVQDFTPTPMTIATEMYYAEMYPDGKPLYVAKTPEQKANQKRFFFWYIPENRIWIQKTLERLKLGKVSRLLLSHTSYKEGRTYEPSKERAKEREQFRKDRNNRRRGRRLGRS